jgi:hypothetical protein
MLLDVRSGSFTTLPELAPTGERYDWFMVGSRYVVAPGFAYEIATGTVTSVAEATDPDLPGASVAGLCPRLRSRVEGYASEGFGALAFDESVLARNFRGRGMVSLESCTGRQLLRVQRGQERAVGFDIRGGLLTWDTATSEGRERSNYRGSLYSYVLGSGRRQRWRLPVLPGLEEPPNERGTFGYSTHTSNTVFWLADARLSEGTAPYVARWTVFAAKLR